MTAFGVLSLMGPLFGCGDDKPARDQTVFWMTLNSSQGQMCSSFSTFSRPDETARTTITGSGQGERLVDGEDESFVECSVREAGSARQLDVDFNMTSGEIGNFSVQGQLTMVSDTEGSGQFDISFTTPSFSLQQDDCSATARAGLAGAVWLDNLSCPGLIDPRSPNVSCDGTGGLIAENCAR